MKLRPEAPKRRLLWDIETDGLLPQLTRVHILCIRDVDTRETWLFRRNKKMDNILDGVEMLNEAELIIGHNIVGFDMRALWKVYGDKFNPQGKVRDSLVMVRMLFADEKERDFRRFRRGELEGKWLGSHELGAWGARLGYPKDDYTARRKEQAAERWAADPSLLDDFDDLEAYTHWWTWGFWNQEMEDYCEVDIDVTEALWQKIESKPWPERATILEHRIHETMERVQENGFPFDAPMGRELEDQLLKEWEEKTEVAKAHFGKWWVPSKWLTRNKTTTYLNPETMEVEKGLPAFRPREEFGEDSSRNSWGEIVVPKRSVHYTDQIKAGGDKTEGCAYCPIKLVEFNPNSRPQIINRLTKIYDWEPQEFTEAGNPSVTDEVLRDLALRIPICDDLAEIFYYTKRLGQLADGPQAWLKKVEERGDGKVHTRTVVGGTVTNRAAHSSFNIAQVPRVVFKTLDQWVEEAVELVFSQGKITYGVRDAKGEFKTGLTPLLGPDGKQIKGVPVRDKLTNDFVLDDEGKVKTKKSLLKGRPGDHGWNCRNLFYVPEGWVLMGADQKGIELRAMAHYMAEFDQGAYGKLVLEADPHDLHQAVMELPSRDTAKTVIYALIYGAGDYKLGVTVDPLLVLHPKKAKALGAEMRRRLMTRIPALNMVSRAVQREASRGYVDALDGRHLYVRAKHAAFNTKLQGAAATIAKQWVVNFEEYCEEDGMVNGWDGDFAILAWIHDEIQVAIRDPEGLSQTFEGRKEMERITAEIMKESVDGLPRRTGVPVWQIAARNCIDAAIDAGNSFGFRLPVDIDVKWGKRWADTH